MIAELQSGRGVVRSERFCGSAARGGTRRLLAACLALLLAACAGSPPDAPEPGIHTAQPPSADERYCAWFGDARDGVLYFGESAFWSSLRAAGGRATADLDRAGPARIGRFDLARERLLPPLDVGGAGDRSGVWDVLAHPNGRVYFTTYFATAGYVEPGSGAVQRFAAAGFGLNELALGPDGSILASRYGNPETHAGGSVVVLDADGAPTAELVLHPPRGFLAAPKTVAYDPGRAEIWVTTDLLPEADSTARGARHDAFVLDLRGRELRRVQQPEIQFVAFAADGTGYLAEVDGRELWLRIVPPPTSGEGAGERRLLLADDFPRASDFVQDIQLPAGGGVVLTRWSGWVHLVGPQGSHRKLRLPALAPDGIYYTAVLTDRRVCATYCGDVSVVCRALDSRR